jgi:transposase
LKPYRDITDEEWEMIIPLLPELRPRKESRGRPLTNTRAVLNGVLWVIFSGASWATLPRKYPSYQTCHRRFQGWYQAGVLKLVISQLFGTSSDAIYALITARMRRGARSAEPVAATAGMTDTLRLPAGPTAVKVPTVPRAPVAPMVPSRLALAQQMADV